jgi:hypothetical protein
MSIQPHDAALSTANVPAFAMDSSSKELENCRVVSSLEHKPSSGINAL